MPLCFVGTTPQPLHLAKERSVGGRLGMGTPRRSKKYNLEIGANPLSFCQRSNEWVLRVVRGG
jgi:hypothetical protein